MSTQYILKTELKESTWKNETLPDKKYNTVKWKKFLVHVGITTYQYFGH